MTQKTRELARKANEWLQYADEDLRLAEHAFALSSSVPYRLIAYHAQQCVEKSLKAYLVYQDIDFSFTHNIGKLLDWCGANAAWTIKIRKTEELTPFAVTARYPGIHRPVTRQAAMRAVKTAKKARTVVVAALKKAGLDIPEAISIVRQSKQAEKTKRARQTKRPNETKEPQKIRRAKEHL
jgi:HEPN domain-containing protein